MPRVDLVSFDLDTLAKAKGTLLEMALRFGPKFIVALLIMAAGLLVGRWTARAMSQALHGLHLEPPVRQLLSRLTRMLVLLLFAMLALQNLGVELLPLIAGMGVAGAAIALATQSVLGNVIAGLMIIFTRPFRVGEYIAIVGVEGVVESITMSTTELRVADRSRVVVPNRKIVGEILHNYGHIRQAELQVGVANDADLVLALQIAGEVVRAHPKVLKEPAPAVMVARIGPATVQIAIKPWLDIADYGSVETELIIRILAALRKQGIVIPFPQ